jgi:hypothetical protein
MTQEQKELLTKDLCGRLPWGVKGLHRDKVHHLMTVNWGWGYQSTQIQVDNYDAWFPIDSFKPYLRPMESMTEDEKKEWHATFESVYDLVPGGDPDNEDDYDDNWHEEPGIESYDYLNAHHFDYRGLIPMGIALPAPEGMYK